jgi:prepilin-type N-terminal cleavage/methylation domain-containing protein
MMKRKETRSAFTMIELVLAIVVIGILAALAIPRMERDIRQEAADNILSAIRYTQHLALTDDKTDPFDSEWQKKLWKIQFTVSSDPKGSFYTISSDSNKNGSVAKEECAVDPANGKYLYNTGGWSVGVANDESPNIFIGHKYGINGLNPSGGCSNIHHIAFDQLGRPHVGIGGAGNDYATYMTSDCTLTFSLAGGEDNISIVITKETGYAYILGQPGS